MFLRQDFTFFLSLVPLMVSLFLQPGQERGSSADLRAKDSKLGEDGRA